MRHFCRAALLAASSLIVTSAHAKTDEEIVVTATRTPAPRQALPAQIDLIDVDRARARGHVTLDAALADLPGIQAPRTGPPGQQASIFSGGFESNHTLFLFDGVRIDDPSTPEGIFDAGQDLLGDIQRIEVVQGPMSALYGSGALGGVVNMLARRGREGVFNPRLDIAAGSFGASVATAGADGTLGRLRYALTADAYASEGYDIVPVRIAAHSGEKDGAEMTVFTGVFDLALSDAIGVDVLLRQREASADYDPGIFGNIAESPEARILQNDTRLWRLGMSWTASEALRLRLFGGELDTDRVTSDLGVIGDEYHGDRAFAELSATWRARRWMLQAGLQTEDEKIDAVSFGSRVAGSETHWGAYFSAQGAIGAADVTAAVRQDDFEGFGAKTTWRAGLAYGIGAARVHGAYGASYRAPSLYERFVPFFGAAELHPESAVSWEVGGQAEFELDGRADAVQIGALYRSSDVEDLIGFAGFSYANVDRAEIDFAEVRFSLQPLDWLTMRVSYANTGARDAATDAPLQRRPRHAWSMSLQGQHGPLTAELSWREVGARRDTVYDDLGMFSGIARVEAYDVVGASMSWAASDALRIFLAADNVLDETYEPVNGFAGAPASFLIGVRFDPSVQRSQ